jgi:hypothetical protein
MESHWPGLLAEAPAEVGYPGDSGALLGLRPGREARVQLAGYLGTSQDSRWWVSAKLTPAVCTS